jgi:magnesium transporter
MKSIQATIERCVKNPTQVTRGPDRVAHTILDVMVDHYLPVLNEFSEDINEFEKQITGETATHRLDHIMRLRRELMHLGQIIRPQREIIHRFVRGEFPMIRAKLIPYYRDIYDHLSRYQDLADSYRDSLNATLQVILSLSANQTSEILKFLTLITVVTMPVMIIGTWYGMNFEGMPELKWERGYFYSVIATAISTLATVWYFRIKKWL